MNLALCCISIALQEQGHKFQTMTFTRFKSLPRKEAVDILSARILNNFKVTNKTIQYCFDNGIKGYRLSSDITPTINHPEVNIRLTELPNWKDIQNEIQSIKKTILDTGIRVSAHPSEYISLTSSSDTVINNSIRDLEQHGEIFDLLALPQDYNSPLNIHCRQDGDPEEVSKTFAKNFNKLSDSVKKRLVLEVNDNKDGTWHISNLIKYFNKELGMPITFDNLHHKFCNDGSSEEDAFLAAYSTWPTTPLFHFSEGISNTRKHSDFACSSPNDYGKNVFWDVELKQKDYAIAQILKNKIIPQMSQ